MTTLGWRQLRSVKAYERDVGAPREQYRQIEVDERLHWWRTTTSADGFIGSIYKPRSACGRFFLAHYPPINSRRDAERCEACAAATATDDEAWTLEGEP